MRVEWRYNPSFTTKPMGRAGRVGSLLAGDTVGGTECEPAA